MAKSDYAVKQSLTKEGYEVYNEISNKLQDGSNKSKLAAKENAFIYARMAESWAKIRNEYGDTAYTAKDFMAEHTVNIGKTNKNKGLKEFTQKEASEADIRLRADIETWGSTVDKINKKRPREEIYVMKTPIVLQMVGAPEYDVKFGIAKWNAIKKAHEEMDEKKLKEVPAAISDPIAIFKSTTRDDSVVVITEIIDDSTKANVIVPIKLEADDKNKEYKINIITSVYARRNKERNGIQKDWFTYQFENKEREWEKGKPKLRAKALYLNTKKITDWYTANGVQFPVSESYHIDDYFDYSIADENDLRNAKKGKILNTGQGTTFDQRAWHGSGMDFNEFNLEKALTGAGDMVHGWSIYTTKNKKTARAYKKHAKSKGLPSYQYEVDIPFIDVRPCV